MLAVGAPTILPTIFGAWSVRLAFVAALLVPVVILRIADARLRAAD